LRRSSWQPCGRRCLVVMSTSCLNAEDRCMFDLATLALAQHTMGLVT
jgi:hypothetical protein